MQKKLYYKLKYLLNLGLVFTLIITGVIFVNAQEENNKPIVDGVSDFFDFENIQENAIDSLINDNIKIHIYGSSATLSDDEEVFGKSLQFGQHNNNKAVINNYINTGLEDTSFSFWYKHNGNLDNGNNEDSVLLQQTGSGKTLLSRKANGTLKSYINGQNAISQGIIPANQWVHIAVTFNQDTKIVKFYINGSYDSQANMGNQVTNLMTDLRIGAHKIDNNGTPHPMRGKMDDLYIFKGKLLSDSEITILYNDKALPLLKISLSKLIEQAEEIISNTNTSNQHQILLNLRNVLNNAKNFNTSQDSTILEVTNILNELQNAIIEYQNNIPITITINSNDINKNIDSKSIFGINHRYAFNGYGSFDPILKQVKPEFTALYKKADFGSIRYPGGTISNLFNWKTARGSESERRLQIHGFYNYPNQHGIAPNFGLPEIASFANEVESEMVYVYSLARGNINDVADLVEYLNAEVGINFNGGIDWAKVRADEGHPKPFNVRYFEMGNEMNQGGRDGSGSQQYWLPFVQGKNAESAYIEGGIASFTQQYAVLEEDWNKASSVSDGSPNMKRYMRYANVNPKTMDENNHIVNDLTFEAVKKEGLAVFVGDDRNKTEWQMVENFNSSTPQDTHYVIDFSDGSILFGDGLKGAIPQLGKQIYVTYKVQKDGFQKLSKALKDAMDEINKRQGTSLAVNVYTSYETQGFITKMEQLGFNNYYDGMSIHPYSGTIGGTVGGNIEAGAFYDEAMKKAETSGVNHVKKFVDLLPEGKVPVISEFGIFKNTQSQVRSLTHALYIAKDIVEYVKLGSPYIQKHCLVDWYSPGADALGPTQQAVIQAVKGVGADTLTGEGLFTFFSTPSAYVFEMLNNNGFADKVISLEVSDHSKINHNVTPVTGLASKDDEDNLYLALVNVDRINDRFLNIVFNDIDDLENYQVEVKTLTSNDITDENTPEDKNKVQITTKFINLSELKSYILPKHSFTTIKLIKQDDKNNLLFENNNAPKDFRLNIELIQEADDRLYNVEDYKILDISIINPQTNEIINYNSNEVFGNAKLILLKENDKEVKKVIYLGNDNTTFIEKEIIKQDDNKIILNVDSLAKYALLYSEAIVVDKTELNNVITSIDEIKLGYKFYNASADKKANLITFLENANRINNYQKATSREVLEATTLLKNAIDELDGQITNKLTLESMINIAESVKLEDRYLKESLKEEKMLFDKSLEFAKKLLIDVNASQVLVDNAVVSLKLSLDKLDGKPKETIINLNQSNNNDINKTTLNNILIKQENNELILKTNQITAIDNHEKTLTDTKTKDNNINHKENKSVNQNIKKETKSITKTIDSSQIKNILIVIISSFVILFSLLLIVKKKMNER